MIGLSFVKIVSTITLNECSKKFTFWNCLIVKLDINYCILISNCIPKVIPKKERSFVQAYGLIMIYILQNYFLLHDKLPRFFYVQYCNFSSEVFPWSRSSLPPTCHLALWFEVDSITAGCADVRDVFIQWTVRFLQCISSCTQDSRATLAA